ncbi:MAG TPA: ATPase domain-containing protein [Opitutaceae bacterium]|jgi:circadian clock protein KaiC|nr:ATPase domain-containing protein [Opitutaceae bacterium]
MSPPILPRVKIGILGIDDILAGGLLPNRLYLIQGDPGAGKTTFGLQYLLQGKALGERCLYVTLSESAEELTAGAASHGWSLQGIEILELAASEEDLQVDTQVTMYNPSEVELTETTKAVVEAFNRVRPSRVIFDSLSEFRLLAQDSLRYRRQVLALKQFFIGKGCTVLLLDDGTSEGPDIQLQSIAHGVVQLEQLSPSYGAERRRLRVLKFRGSSYRGGFHDFVIRQGGLEVFPRLVSSEHREAFKREPIPSGVAGLDALLGGGPDRGTSTLLMGPAGSGKSTVAVQYAVAAAERGDHSVVFAFDESLSTLEARTAGLGIAFKSGIDKGSVKLEQIDPAELSPGEFVHRVRTAVERDHARVVVIDSLNGYLNAMPEERFLIAQLHELLTYLAIRGVTTIMVVAQHGLLGSQMQTPVDTSYLADTVVLFRYFETEGQVKKAISVLKKRSGRHEEFIRELQFSSKGITVSPPLREYRGVLSGIPVPVSLPPPRE